jgi:hypothetical protein
VPTAARAPLRRKMRLVIDIRNQLPAFSDRLKPES